MPIYDPLLGDSLITDEDLKAIVANYTQASGIYKELQYVDNLDWDGNITNREALMKLMHLFGALPIRLSELTEMKKAFREEQLH